MQRHFKGSLGSINSNNLEVFASFVGLSPAETVLPTNWPGFFRFTLPKSNVQEFPLFSMVPILLAASSATALGAVSIQFSSAAFGRATNWLDGNGISTTKMVWGIVVDTAGNGFKPGEYLSGFAHPSGTPTPVAPPPYVLQTVSGPTDDLVILSANLMGTISAPTDAAPTGMNQLTFLSVFS